MVYAGYDVDIDDEEPEEKKEKGSKKEEEKNEKSFEHLTMADWKKMYREEIASADNTDNNLDLGHISVIFIAAHVIGFLIKHIPPYITLLGSLYAFNTDLSIFAGLGALSLLFLLFPFVTKRLDYHSVVMLNILCLLELGTSLICISMYNFSLGFILGVVYVPFAAIMHPTFNRYVN